MNINAMTHNLIAMNTQRSLGINTQNKAKSVEKLSSGYKINRGADDAAGLAISEKMRKMIRGLNQGTEMHRMAFPGSRSVTALWMKRTLFYTE